MAHIMRRRVTSIPIVAVAISDHIATIKSVDEPIHSTAHYKHTKAHETQVVLVDRAFLRRIPWQRNDTVVVRSPRDRRRLSTGRLRHFEGEYARIRDKAGFATFVPVPRGHCWVEFEGASTNAGGSKLYETIPLALVEGRVACVLWPASRVRWLDRK